MPPTPDGHHVHTEPDRPGVSATHHHEYDYRLDLMGLDLNLARFVYTDAPAPTADDTALELNRPSWEALGCPMRLHVQIRPEPRP